MFEQVPCYITVQDRDFNLLAVNKMFEDDFGQGVGEKCYAAYKGRDNVCPGCSVANTFEDGQIHSAEETVIRQDGSKIHFLVQTAPLLDHEGD
ncbi:MAG: PAS domain-containing protein, partial [Deltaproteobacteria bacterium]|nr:PAS domain-containing protein [Deltaproteobacteria bacterium]